MLSVDTTELCLKLHPLGPKISVPVTAVSVDTELVVYSKGVKGQLSETGVVSAGGTVALLLDSLHCVFSNNKNNTKLF